VTNTVTPYHRLIGDAPECGPGDHDRARRYVDKIEHALERGGWSNTHRNRLYRLRALWTARAQGLDPRFEIVGSQVGRLPRAVENEIDKERNKIKSRQNIRKALKKKPKPSWANADKYRDEDYDDPVLRDERYQPQSPAKGGPGSDADSDEGEDASTPGGGGKWRRARDADEEYFVSASDSKGHNERIQLRVQPRHMTALQRIKDEKRFPFETISDIARWCIDKGIEELNQRRASATVGSVLVQARVISNFLREEKHAQDYEDALNEIRNTITRYRNSGARGEAVRVVARVKYDIEQMHEGYWRERHLETLHREFSDLLDGTSGPIVSFVENDVEAGADAD
jgi:hypothetical protein